MPCAPSQRKPLFSSVSSSASPGRRSARHGEDAQTAAAQLVHESAAAVAGGARLMTLGALLRRETPVLP
jgi:hypothetical protein